MTSLRRISRGCEAARHIGASGRRLREDRATYGARLGRRAEAALSRHPACGAPQAALDPVVGTPRDDLEPGYRSLVAGVHVIVYRVGVDVVEVIRVVHGSMDVLDQLSDESAAPDEAEDGP